MGCWNGTCGVTQLSINHGDPVAYFLLANVDDRETHDDGHCHAEDIWCPIGLPVYAEYNDYGSIEEIKNMDAMEHLIDLLKIHAVPHPAKNEYRAVVVPADLDFDRIEDALHDGVLRIYDRAHFAYSRELAKRVELEDCPPELKEVAEREARRPDSFRVGAMMVHQEVYEALCQNYHHWLNEKPIWLDTTIKEAQASYAKLVEELKKDISILERYGSLFIMEYLIGREKRCLFTEFFTSYPIYARQYIDTYAEKLVALAKEGVESPEIITEICRFQTFRVNMQALRKTWAPQSGAGSQHENYGNHHLLNRVSQDIIDRKLAEREAWAAEDEEE